MLRSYGGRELSESDSCGDDDGGEEEDFNEEGEEEEVEVAESDIPSWHSIKARNVLRAELQRDVQRDQLVQLAEEFGVDLSEPVVPVDESGTPKVIVLTTNQEALSALLKRVDHVARKHGLESVLVHNVLDFKEKLVTRGMQRALLMVDTTAERCGGWEMVRWVRQHRRAELRDSFITVIVNSEDEIERMPADAAALIRASPRWARILRAKLPSDRSLSHMFARAAQLVGPREGTAAAAAPRRRAGAAARGTANEDIVCYRTVSGQVRPLPRRRPPHVDFPQTRPRPRRVSPRGRRGRARTCPISTGGGTRRVRSVRGAWGGGARADAAGCGGRGGAKASPRGRA
jgi:hypothetical protein